MGIQPGTKIKRKVGGKILDISGQKFGRLLVLEYTGYSLHQAAVWKCLCECGNYCEAGSHQLKRGYKKSCGCLKEERKLEFGESSFNAVYRRYTIQAKKRSILFELSKERFYNLTQQKCFYCGEMPLQIYTRDNAHGFFKYNGVDRLNSNLGYCIDNCVSCCWRCNVMKHNFTQEEFFNHMKKILEYRKRI